MALIVGLLSGLVKIRAGARGLGGLKQCYRHGLALQVEESQDGLIHPGSGCAVKCCRLVQR